MACKFKAMVALIDSPARPPECTIQSINPISRSDDDNLSSRVQAIHECQQRADNAVVDLILLATPHLQTGNLALWPSLSQGDKYHIALLWDIA